MLASSCSFLYNEREHFGSLFHHNLLNKMKLKFDFIIQNFFSELQDINSAGLLQEISQLQEQKKYEL